jgi:hypothetical protein
MSRREQNLKRTERQQGSAMRSELRSSRPKLLIPRLTGLRDLPELLSQIWQAGNTAVNRLLNRSRSGRPLDSKTRTEMEQAFNTDFTDVRLHQNASAQAATEAVDAVGFTHGDDIYLTADAPNPESPAGRTLIAHELAHVVQQRRTADVKAEMSQPGDRFEQAADRVAQQALQGQTVESAVGGAPPAIQRQQRRGNRASREEARAALEAWLRRVMQQQGGRSVRVTAEVRSAVTGLFSGDIGRQIGIEAWLNSPALPGDPADFAREVARRLPETIDRARIERLNRMSGQAPGQTSTMGRAREVFERTAPGSPEREEEREAESIAKGEAKPSRTRIPAREGAAPGVPTPEERIEQVEQLGRRIRGEEEPTTIGPFSVDVLRLGRVFGAREEILRGPRAPRPVLPEARTYPEVERAIQQLAPDAVVPAQFRGTGKAGDFADARLVASDLARRLDVAQQQNQESIQLRLGDNYNSVRDRAAMIAEINRIIQLIRDALPHHATNVKFVDVFFGERLVTRGMARRAE